MLFDLTDNSLQTIPVDETLGEIQLSSVIREKLQNVFENEGENAIIFPATSRVKGEANTVYFSNHWFYLAVLCKKYALALYQYCDFFDTRIRQNADLVNELGNNQFDSRTFSSLFSNNQEKEFFIKFIQAAEDFRPGKNLFNIRDGKIIPRQSKDVFGSSILKKINIPDASSGYFGSIVYYLAKNKNVYDALEAEVNEFLIRESEEMIIVEQSSDALTIEDLGLILKEMYNDPDATHKTTAIHMFGIKYADIIDKKGYSCKAICKFAGLGDTHYDAEISKGVNIYKSIAANEYGIKLYKTIKQVAHSLKTGENVLLYGVPGCGKSYTIKTQYCDNENYMERVVFHPDYAYSDFVGQILPQNVDGNITYPFVEGPFTRILKRAVNDADNNYYLIIEELNRGNAPAIFGDLFQLLDRVNGESEYGISNADIALKVYEDKDHLVKIPSNLFILATTNTADQNVFTLDTAFKRRWKMVSIPNDFTCCELRNIKIGGTELTWEKFAEVINDMIVDNNLSSVSSEDKRLGAYFATEEQLKSNKMFAEKVLAYLWDDVFKYDKDKLFRTDIRTLEELIKEFESTGLEVFAPMLRGTFETKLGDIEVQ